MIKISLRCVCWLPLLTILAGCSQDREAALIGAWNASPTYGLGTAFQLKEQTPSASSSEVMDAARKLSSTGIDIRQDKTFQLAWADSILEGTWTFAKDTGELVLSFTKGSQLDGTAIEEAGKLGPWAAYLQDDNELIRLYPVSPAMVEQVKKSGGPLAKGVPLRKSAD